MLRDHFPRSSLRRVKIPDRERLYAIGAEITALKAEIAERQQRITQLEEEFGRSDMLLLETGKRPRKRRVVYKLKPRTKGLSDRVFEALYARPGEALTVAEIIAAADAEGREQSVRTVLRRLAIANAGVISLRRGVYSYDRSKAPADEEVGF